MKNLITGGTGYIGTRLARLLAERGEDVRVFGLPTQSSAILQHERIKVFHGNLLVPGDLHRALSGCDRVYHLAAYARNWAPDPTTFYRANTEGTEIVLSACMDANVSKVVCVSSNVTFGPSNGKAVDESSKRRFPPYTEHEHSKILAEQIARKYAHLGLEVVIVNPARVFGPGMMGESNSVTRMIELYLKGRWRVIPGNGKAIGNYVFVDDLIKGFVAAMEHGRSGENYILGGANVSFDEFFEIVSWVSKKRFHLFHLPDSVAVAFAKIELFFAQVFRRHPLITPGWVQTFLVNWEQSSKKAERELGFKTTSFPEAIRVTIEWILNGQTLQGGRA